MTTKTLLNLTNEVGKNLRRSTGTTYTTITQNQDVITAVQMINEAKRMVEDAWKWDQLTTNVTFSSVASQRAYDLGNLSSGTGAVTSATVTNERSYVLKDRHGRIQFFDITNTNGFRMREMKRDRFESAAIGGSAEQAIPQAVTLYQAPAGGIQVEFPFVPSDNTRRYSVECYIPQDDLTVATTVLLAPWRLVVLAATAMAIEERGEELGLDSVRWWEQYNDAFHRQQGVDSDEVDVTLQADTLQYFHSGNHDPHGIIG